MSGQPIPDNGSNVDIQVIPQRHITAPEPRLFQYAAVDEFTRLRFLAVYPEQPAYSPVDFLKKLAKWYAGKSIWMELIQATIQILL